MVKYTHEQKVIIFVVGHMAELRKAGVLSGGGFDLSDEGYERFVNLRDSGWKPTDEEFDNCLDYLLSKITNNA